MVAAAFVIVHAVTNRGWELVWHDDFDGTSVQASQWNVRNETYLPYEHSILTARPQNVRVDDGRLSITARREKRSVGVTQRDYTSGYLDTIGKHSWRYGRFEVRAKLPMATGLWPAFWLRADDGLGEIDVMEAIGGMPSFVQQAVLQSTQGDKAKLVNRHTLAGSTVAAWHVYGVEVAPGSISYEVDHHRVYKVTDQQAPWLADTFNRPLNIRLNLQVGGTLPDYYNHPLTSQSRLPDAYQIDWVRVYQR